MSLNRIEQMVFDYVQRHAEERHYWQAKVRELMQKSENDFAAATALAGGLWMYYEERCRVVPQFHEISAREGLRRISLRNLAEHLMKIWGPVRPVNPSRRIEAE
jgi:hypothetical protein